MPTPDRPNILLITTDQQRSDALGINNNWLIDTANLDALAASGTNFTRAYSTTPSCVAACMFRRSSGTPSVSSAWTRLTRIATSSGPSSRATYWLRRASMW